MKRAIVFSVPSAHQNGYVWKWRCVESNTESAEAFPMYHDCVRDAEQRGYEVESTRATGLSAPGGDPHRLR